MTPGPGPLQWHRWYCSSDVYTEVTISLAPSTMLSLSQSHPQHGRRLCSCSDDNVTLSYPQHYPPAPGTPPGDVYTEVSTICTMSLSLSPTSLRPPSRGVHNNSLPWKLPLTDLWHHKFVFGSHAMQKVGVKGGEGTTASLAAYFISPHAYGVRTMRG